MSDLTGLKSFCTAAPFVVLDARGRDPWSKGDALSRELNIQKQCDGIKKPFTGMTVAACWWRMLPSAAEHSTADFAQLPEDTDIHDVEFYASRPAHWKIPEPGRLRRRYCTRTVPPVDRYERS